MLDEKNPFVDFRGVKLPAVADSIRAVKRKASSEWLLFLLFVGPNLILFGIFTYWPLIYSFYLSTVRWDMLAPRKRPVGLGNYEYLLHNDTFHKVMWNSLFFTVGAVGGSMLLGLLSALLLNQKLRGRNTARAIVFMPTLLSGAAIGIVWVYIFDPRYGLMRTCSGVSSPTVRARLCAGPICCAPCQARAPTPMRWRRRCYGYEPRWATKTSSRRW